MSNYQKVLGAVYHCPQDIPRLYKELNPIVMRRILHKLVPRSAGIEIECCGALGNHSKFKGIELGDIFFHDFYRVHSVQIDFPKRTSIDIINEHRIRIKDYTQLIGLYNILRDMKESCSYSESGIHIHIDATDIMNNIKAARLTGGSIFRNESYFDYVLAVFLNKQKERIDRIVGGYSGKYNSKITSYGAKFGWVNIRKDTKTIEFRACPLSFEYSDVIYWIIEFTRIIKELAQHVSNFIKNERIINPNYHRPVKKYYVPLIKENISFKKISGPNDVWNVLPGSLYLDRDYTYVQRSS